MSVQTFQWIRDLTAIFCILGWILLYFIDAEYTRKIRRNLAIIFVICIILLLYNIYLVEINQ